MTFPRDTESRLAERVRIAQRAEKRAEEAANRMREESLGFGMTLKCGGAARYRGEGRHPWHADEEGGCRDDGGACICACHDVREPAAVVLPGQHGTEER